MNNGPNHLLWWVIPNVLAGMPMPFLEPSRRLEGGTGFTAHDDDMVLLYRAGIRAIVSLLNIPSDAAIYERAGFSFLCLPVPDGGAPSIESAYEFVRFVNEQRASGRPVAVHCEAGLGRTGTMLAVYLISEGETAESAIGQIRKLEPAAIETPRQIFFLKEFSARYTSSQSDAAEVGPGNEGMYALDRERWERLRSNGLRSNLRCLFEELSRRYSEPHRHYHNARHIDECLQEFDAVRGEAVNPLALELAIWFHDVVYDPRASDNEERSAGYAVECLQQARNDLARQVSDLILTTKTHLPGIVRDAALLIDIDLSILGRSAERFAQFEDGIRQEYAWVPHNVYCEKRAEILRGFLKREQIYITKTIHDRYEKVARENISRLITRLGR